MKFVNAVRLLEIAENVARSNLAMVEAYGTPEAAKRQHALQEEYRLAVAVLSREEKAPEKAPEKPEETKVPA